MYIQILTIALVLNLWCHVTSFPSAQRRLISYNEEFVRRLHPRRPTNDQKKSTHAVSQRPSVQHTQHHEANSDKLSPIPSKDSQKSEDIYDYQYLEYLYDYDHLLSELPVVTSTQVPTTTVEITTKAIRTTTRKPITFPATPEVESSTVSNKVTTKSPPTITSTDIWSMWPFRYTTVPSIHTKRRFVSRRRPGYSNKPFVSRNAAAHSLASPKIAVSRDAHIPRGRMASAVDNSKQYKYPSMLQRQSRARNNLRLKEVLVLEIDSAPKVVSLVIENPQSRVSAFSDTKKIPQVQKLVPVLVQSVVEGTVSSITTLPETTSQNPTTFKQDTSTLSLSNRNVEADPITSIQGTTMVSTIDDLGTTAELTTASSTSVTTLYYGDSSTGINATLGDNTTPSIPANTTLSPLAQLSSQLGRNPLGANPIGDSPFGTSPAGLLPFGLSPGGIAPQGLPPNVTTSSSTQTTNGTTTIKEERIHVQFKKADGSINGDYVVLDHSTGNLNGVRYEAVDGADPALIQKALLSFLSLDPRLDPTLKLK